MKLWLQLALALLVGFPAAAQEFTNPPVLVYRLLEGSALLDDCLICGRPTIIRPLRGTFTLVQTNVNPLTTQYHLRDIDFHTDEKTNAQYRIRGEGAYQVGGHLAIQQDMVLCVEVNDAPHVFTNENRSVIRQFPLLEISLSQTQQNLIQFFSLNLVAAPLREVWFSTSNRSVPSLVTDDGRVVKTAPQLGSRFQFVTPALLPEIVDAVDVQPGGEIYFSLAFQGQLHSSALQTNVYDGDILSDRGTIVRRNQQLTAQFGIMPAVPDLGLDALFVTASGEFLFSIKTNAVSERLGRLLRRGDLLSDAGRVVMSNAELLQRFSPAVAQDYGLDAVHVWPHGEVWFSTEIGFRDQNLGDIAPGDLLSSQGIIVLRNRELAAPFNPAKETNDFGLDGLFIVSDYTTLAAPPRITAWNATIAPHCRRVEWTGAGRVFQLEGSDAITGPFAPVSPIQPELSFEICHPPDARRFYRVRQW